MLITYLDCLFHTRGNHLFELNLFQKWTAVRLVSFIDMHWGPLLAYIYKLLQYFGITSCCTVLVAAKMVAIIFEVAKVYL